MSLFRPNVGDENSFASSSNGVFKNVGQFRLSIGNVVSLFVGQSDDNLFEKSQRFVDVGGFNQLLTLRT